MMKKPRTFKASSSLFGAVLMLSLLGAIALTSIDALLDLYEVFKTQWLNFADSLSMLQPHRTVFPN